MATELSAVTGPSSALPVKRTLTALLTIAALLLCLVGMHAMAIHPSSSVHTNGQSQVLQGAAGHTNVSAIEIVHTTGVANSPGSAFDFFAQGCAGMWEMDCLILGIVGAFSLLIGLLLSKLTSPQLTDVREMVRLLPIHLSKIRHFTTPSLHVLSISRT